MLSLLLAAVYYRLQMKIALHKHSLLSKNKSQFSILPVTLGTDHWWLECLCFNLLLLTI